MHHYLKTAQAHLLAARRTTSPELKTFKYLDAINSLYAALPYCRNDKKAWSRVMNDIKHSRKALKLHAV